MANWTGQDIALIVSAIFSGLAALLGATATIFSIWAKIKADGNSHELAMHQKRVEAGFEVVEGDIREVKHATNSMKDALVAAGRKEGEADGRAAEKADQIAINAKAEQIAGKQSAGQITVDSADISVESAQITVDKKPVTEGDNPTR